MKVHEQREREKPTDRPITRREANAHMIERVANGALLINNEEDKLADDARAGGGRAGGHSGISVVDSIPIHSDPLDSVRVAQRN